MRAFIHWIYSEIHKADYFLEWASAQKQFCAMFYNKVKNWALSATCMRQHLRNYFIFSQMVQTFWHVSRKFTFLIIFHVELFSLTPNFCSMEIKTKRYLQGKRKLLIYSGSYYAFTS